MRFRPAILWIVLLLSTACMPRGPIAGAVVPEGVGGTIAGRVTDAENTAALPERRVVAVNTETGERFGASTGVNGGYTIKVPAGTYRLELELRTGEMVKKQPAPTTVGVGDLDADRNFVVAVPPPA